MRPLTFGSLFSGIGGMDLGLERAGMVCKWQVEIDPYARGVLWRRWPGIPKHRDIRAVGIRCLERPDVLAGGFPCQDISIAGRGAGIDGDKSGLWSEFARIIRELRPAYVLVENSPALRSRGLGRVLGDLAALGFDAEWDCIPAAALGAPHRRDRLFLVAYPVREQEWIQSEPQPRSRRAPVAGDDGEAGVVAYAPGHGQGARVFRRPPVASAWPPESGFRRVAYGVPDQVDRLTCLGNAVVPSVAEYVGRLIVEHAGAA